VQPGLGPVATTVVATVVATVAGQFSFVWCERSSMSSKFPNPTTAAADGLPLKV